MKVTEDDLGACLELLELKSNKAAAVTPWAVDTVKKFNECAASKATLAAKVGEHNKKSKNKNKNEEALEVSP